MFFLLNVEGGGVVLPPDEAVIPETMRSFTPCTPSKEKSSFVLTRLPFMSTMISPIATLSQNAQAGRIASILAPQMDPETIVTDSPSLPGSTVIDLVYLILYFQF